MSENQNPLPQKCYSNPTNGLLCFAPRGEAMKLNRLILASLIGISLSTPAWACDPGKGGFSFFHHNDSDHDKDNSSHHDHDGDKNTHGGCSGGDHSGGGSGSSGGGGSTNPPAK